MAAVTFDSLSKVFPDGTRAVSDMDLEIADGEFMVLVGPSGCGKTTALRMVAGLEEISEGELRIGNSVVNHVPPRDRDIAMVFQSYALYPHLTVYNNIAFGLKLRHVDKEEIKRRVEEAARVLDLSELLDRKPRNLSGGQRQRVAMGRAIVREPQAFLMDEPLSNLDAKLRVQMRAEIASIQRRLEVTTIYVTHDQVEAMTMGDRVAVMRKGTLQQVDSPEQLYDRPANLFVGGFIGSPAMNMMEATLARRNGTMVARVGNQEIDLPKSLLAERPALAAYDGRNVVLGIRPETLYDPALENVLKDGASLPGKVVLREALGSEILVHLSVDGKAASTEDVRELAEDVGIRQLGDHAEADRGAILIARFAPASKVAEGDRVDVALDLSSVHIFDHDTGLGIYDDAPTGSD